MGFLVAVGLEVLALLALGAVLGSAEPHSLRYDLALLGCALVVGAFVVTLILQRGAPQ